MPPMGENFSMTKYEKTSEVLLNCCLFGDTSNFTSLAMLEGGTRHKIAEEFINTTPPLVKSVMVAESLD
jgi:hypothetical protein